MVDVKQSSRNKIRGKFFELGKKKYQAEISKQRERFGHRLLLEFLPDQFPTDKITKNSMSPTENMALLSRILISFKVENRASSLQLYMLYLARMPHYLIIQ